VTTGYHSSQRKIQDNLTLNEMPYTKNEYAEKVGLLSEMIDAAGAPRVADVEEGGIHMSFHFNSVSMTSHNVGARGAICWACVSEYQPLDLLNGRPPDTMRRTDVSYLGMWEIFFFKEGGSIYCSEEVPVCYRNAATVWVNTHFPADPAPSEPAGELNDAE
jgi:hypothetical protein